MSNPTCKVCSTEPSKYRCPTCALMSCSLGCTQAHKVYCTPKATSQLPQQSQSESESGISGDLNGVNVNVNVNANANLDINEDINTDKPKATKPETGPQATNGQQQKEQQDNDEIILSKVQSLLTSSSSSSSSPTLRAHLRDFYRTTLEEEWPEPLPAPSSQAQAQGYSGRGRGGYGRGRGSRGRGGGGGNQNRNYGAWTREKGFGRGLGKVRKFRRECEERVVKGKQAEVFMRFVGIVLGIGYDDGNRDGGGDQSAAATATRG